jgi:hypothetical protein
MLTAQQLRERGVPEGIAGRGIYVPFDRQTVLLSVLPKDKKTPVSLDEALSNLAGTLGELRLVVGLARTKKSAQPAPPDIFMTTERVKNRFNGSVVGGPGRFGTLFGRNDPFLDSCGESNLIGERVVEAQVLIAATVGVPRITFRTVVGNECYDQLGACGIVFVRGAEIIELQGMRLVLSMVDRIAQIVDGQFANNHILTEGAELMILRPNRRFLFDGSELRETTSEQV